VRPCIIQLKARTTQDMTALELRYFANGEPDWACNFCSASW
jgi:hypothetical protein